MTTPSNTGPIQVAILGAGPSGLATAWELSDKRDADDKPLYNITIYDMSWRPGGKCASGRTDTPDRRIVQNGTHYVFGVYFNMFKIVQEAYAILNGNAAGTSDNHAGWGGTDEFIARHVLALKDDCRPPFQNWILPVPCRGPNALPGDVELDLPNANASLDLQLDLIEAYELRQSDGEPRPLFLEGRYALRRSLDLPDNPDQGASDLEVDRAFQECRALTRQLRQLDPRDDVNQLVISELKRVIPELRILIDLSIRTAIAALLLSQRTALACEVRRLDNVVDFLLTLSFALLADGVLLGGALDRLDELDVREWLRSRGLKASTQDSPITLAWYDAIAAYAGGDPLHPRLSAAAFLQTVVPAVLIYRGCFIYQMIGEIGENLTGPVYQVLKDRGVTFRWMHRVLDIAVSQDGKHVDAVRFEIPVSPEPAARGRIRRWVARLMALFGSRGASPRTLTQLHAYDPVIQFQLGNERPRNGFREFPGDPFRDVLPDDTPANAWYAPPATPNTTFLLGRNGSNAGSPAGYDVLVFALPHTVVPHVASQLVSANANWANLSNLPGVETRSLRLWLKSTFPALQWDSFLSTEQPVLATFRDQFFVWEDSGQQLNVHTWPTSAAVPRSIATMFAPHPAPALAPAREADPNYVRDQLRLAAHAAQQFIASEAGRLWFGIANGPGLDLGQVVTPPSNGGGSTSGVAGFVVANAGPLERYVHAAPGTYKHRICPFEPGFDDFYVAGDWVRLWPATGNIEQAIISGRIAGLLIQGFQPSDLPSRVPNFPGYFPH